MSSEELAVDLIGKIGFPIAMCLLVYLDLRKQVLKLAEAIEKLQLRFGVA